LEPETVTYGFALIAGIVVGAVSVLFVQFCASEAAKHRLMDSEFWPTLERVRARTGGRLGVLEPLPAKFDQPRWLRVPDLPDAQTQTSSGAEDWRPVRESRSEDSPLPWDTVDRKPGQHRLRGDDTRDLSVYASVFRESEVAAP
jgi:hypothetical protein